MSFRSRQSFRLLVGDPSLGHTKPSCLGFLANYLFLFQSLIKFTFFLARLYESTGRAIAVTSASASALALALASASALLKMLKFWVKVFMSLYLLKLWMDQVDTLHVGRLADIGLKFYAVPS